MPKAVQGLVVVGVGPEIVGDRFPNSGNGTHQICEALLVWVHRCKVCHCTSANNGGDTCAAEGSQRGHKARQEPGTFADDVTRGGLLRLNRIGQRLGESL